MHSGLRQHAWYYLRPPLYYEVAPSNGKACEEVWMNIGVGYCKEKKGPLGIF